MVRYAVLTALIADALNRFLEGGSLPRLSASRVAKVALTHGNPLLLSHYDQPVSLCRDVSRSETLKLDNSLI